MKVLGSEVDDCQPLAMDDGISYKPMLTGCKGVFLNLGVSVCGGHLPVCLSVQLKDKCSSVYVSVNGLIEISSKYMLLSPRLVALH